MAFKIRLQYHVDLAYEIRDPGGADLIFNVHAAQTPQQTVDDEQLVLSQAVNPDIATDPVTATRFMRLHARQGELHLTYRATVRIAHHRADPATLHEVPARCMPLEVLPYVYPSRYCQSDRLLRMASTNFGELWQGYSRVLAIQHWVQAHVNFASNTTNSNTSDFHAYVEAYLGDRWYLFDASGTGIPMGFLRLGTGRDAADVDFATIFGDVVSMAPFIRVTALDGPGLQTPHHCSDALSTAAASPLPMSGCASFDSKAGPTAPQVSILKQLPDEGVGRTSRSLSQWT